MKNKLIYLLASAALFAAGCSQPEEGAGYGTMRISGTIDATIETRADAPAADEFSLKITDSQNTVQSWATIAEYNAEAPLFLEGAYTILIEHGDPDVEGPDKAAYYSATESVSILRRTETRVALTAKVSNSQTRVRATQGFLNYFHDAEFTVTTGSDNAFTFNPEAVNDGTPVWVKSGTTLKVNGTARRQSQTGTDEGLLTTFSEQTLTGVTKPGVCHIFTFDVDNAGSVMLEITLGDDLTETTEVDSELNDEAIE